MNYYLIDYENIGVAGFDGISNIDANAKVVIFYSEHADKITFGLHRRLCALSDRVEYMRADVSRGKNALDFQLSFYAGLCIKEHPNCKIFIVSKDKGYDSLIKIAKKYSVELSRVENFCNYPVISSQITDDVSLSIYSVLKDLDLNGIDLQELTSKITELFNTYKTKNVINSHIGKYLKDSDLHQKVCKAIKPLLKDKT